MSHFDTPSSGMQFKGPFGGNANIRGDESVSGAVAFLVGEQLAKGAVGIVRQCLDGEERMQYQQFHQLNEGELVVRFLTGPTVLACMTSLSRGKGRLSLEFGFEIRVAQYFWRSGQYFRRRFVNFVEWNIDSRYEDI